VDSDRFNKWLSLSANFAVVAGIIFLGVELKQNNRLLQQQSELVYFHNKIVLTEALMLDSGLAEIYVKASNNEELSDVDTLRIGRYYRRMFRGFEWEYGQHRDGLITISRFNAWTNMINENKYARDTWEWFIQSVASEGFIRFVEENGVTQVP